LVSWFAELDQLDPFISELSFNGTLHKHPRRPDKEYLVLIILCAADIYYTIIGNRGCIPGTAKCGTNRELRPRRGKPTSRQGAEKRKREGYTTDGTHNRWAVPPPVSSVVALIRRLC